MLLSTDAHKNTRLQARMREAKLPRRRVEGNSARATTRTDQRRCVTLLDRSGGKCRRRCTRRCCSGNKKTNKNAEKQTRVSRQNLKSVGTGVAQITIKYRNSSKHPSKPASEQRGTRFDSRSTRRSSVGQLALLQNEEFEVRLVSAIEKRSEEK